MIRCGFKATASTNGTITVELTADPSIYVVQTVPGAPTAVVATTTSTTATFTWTAPATDGGAAIVLAAENVAKP